MPEDANVILNEFYDINESKEQVKQFIEKLAAGGWDEYYENVEQLIQEKINKVIPGLELPKGMSNQQVASLTSLLTSKFNIADNELRDQRKLKGSGKTFLFNGKKYTTDYSEEK